MGEVSIDSTNRIATFTPTADLMGMTDYTHLDPAMQELAGLPDQARIEEVRADRWIDYPRAREALQWIVPGRACR